MVCSYKYYRIVEFRIEELRNLGIMNGEKTRDLGLGAGDLELGT